MPIHEARLIARHVRKSPSTECVLIPRGDEMTTLERLLVIVGALLRALRELDFWPVNFLVGNCLEDVRNAVEPRPAFVVRANNEPRRMASIGLS